MRDMKIANGLTNAEVAENSGVSLKTVEKIMALSCTQDIMRETARLIEDAVIGSSNQYPCYLAFEDMSSGGAVMDELKVVREEAQVAKTLFAEKNENGVAAEVANAAARVARRMHSGKFKRAELYAFACAKCFRLCRNGNAFSDKRGRSIFIPVRKKLCILLVHVNGHRIFRKKRVHTGNMIEMTVRKQNEFGSERKLFKLAKRGFGGGIYNGTFAASVFVNDIAVFAVVSFCNNFNIHRIKNPLFDNDL
jgi:hypothetical protein